MRRWARLSVVSVVAVWALLVGTAVSDPAAAVSAEERVSAESTGVEELPALPSDPVPAEEPSVPAGDAGEVGSLPAPAVADMTVPVGAASLSRHGAVDRGGLEVLSRTETTTTFAAADGARVRRVSQDPLNVRGEDGVWRDISTSVEAVDGGVAGEGSSVAAGVP